MKRAVLQVALAHTMSDHHVRRCPTTHPPWGGRLTTHPASALLVTGGSSDDPPTTRRGTASSQPLRRGVPTRQRKAGGPGGSANRPFCRSCTSAIANASVGERSRRCPARLGAAGPHTLARAVRRDRRTPCTRTYVRLFLERFVMRHSHAYLDDCLEKFASRHREGGVTPLSNVKSPEKHRERACSRRVVPSPVALRSTPRSLPPPNSRAA